MKNVGIYNNIQMFEEDGKIGIVIKDTKDPKNDKLILFDDIKQCDDYLWTLYRISVIDFPYYCQQIQSLARENEMWKDVFERFKIRTK